MFWGPCSYNSGFLLAIFIKSFMRVLLLIGYGYGNWLIYIRLGGILLFEKN